MTLPRRTTMIATIGPATQTPDRLEALIRAGLDIARLNMSHGSADFVRTTVADIRRLAEKVDRRVGILMDLQGPAIRTGDLPAPLPLKPGDRLAFTVRGATCNDMPSVGVNYDGLVNDLKVGDKVLVDNGVFHLRVIAKDATAIRCEVLTPGVLGNRRHINLPGVVVGLPALTDKDLRDIDVGLETGVDFFALSFVRKAADVTELRKLLRQRKGHQWIVAKIENQEGIANFEAILDVVDGVMVARGDLGIEIPFEELPIVQRHMVQTCLRLGKPVIVATQMLESMIENPAPTRAEITDVANAVFTLADAVMLSGETSVGKYPIECFQIMDRIVRRSELDPDWGQFQIPDADTPRAKLIKVACALADDLGPETPLVVFTRSGRMALHASWFRPRRSPIFAITDNKRLLNQLTLHWGLEPFLMELGNDAVAGGQRAAALLREKGRVAAGTRLVVVSDLVIAGERYETIQLHVAK